MASIEVARRKVYYEDHGQEAFPGQTPLLLIMGMSGTCAGWLPLQVPAFAPTRRVIIFDNRGAGESDDPGGPFSIADLAADTAGLLDALKIGKADVLGAFMGGMIAQELALTRPELVRRLVLVGTYARPDAKRRMILEDWASFAEQNASREAMLRQRLLWTVQDETLEQTDLIEALLEFHAKDDRPFSNELFVRQCAACLGHDALDRLKDIACPTLVVCGRYDQLTPARLHRELASAIPDARLVSMTYGGHLVMVESAERFNHMVIQFLDEA